MEIERVIESEMYVLGTCINKNDYLLKVMEKLDTSDFYRSSHKLVFETMINLYKKDIKFDVAMLISSMMDKIKTKAITITEISNISTMTAFSTFKSHLSLLKEQSNHRTINKICKNVLNSELSAEDKINAIQNGLLEIHSKSEEDKYYTAAEMMEKTMAKIEQAYETGDGITGISTGMKSIDNVTNGLQRKEFVIFGARPSMGKTAFSLKLIEGIKGNVLYIQMDMSLEGMGQRMLASNSLLENGKVGRGRLNEEEWEILSVAFSKLATKNNLFFYEPSTTTVSKIRTLAKEIQLKYGLDCVVIDHIGKLTSEINGGTYEQSSDNSKKLKALAKELNVCVIALCQLSRAVEQRADKRPQLSDLRDTGKIEEDADVIGMLYRDGYYRQRQDKEDIKTDILEVDFQKCRNGRVGTIELHYDLTTQRLLEYSSMEDK